MVCCLWFFVISCGMAFQLSLRRTLQRSKRYQLNFELLVAVNNSLIETWLPSTYLTG